MHLFECTGRAASDDRSFQDAVVSKRQDEVTATAGRVSSPMATEAAKKLEDIEMCAHCLSWSTYLRLFDLYRIDIPHFDVSDLVVLLSYSVGNILRNRRYIVVF